MPIYEYACSECDHTLEALQKMSDAVLVDCPACDQPGLIKKISAPGFRLSGSGWYETDFKSGNQKNLTQSDTAKKDAGKSVGESSGKPAGQSKDKPGTSSSNSKKSTDKGATA